MFESIRMSLAEWQAKTSDRAKLQHAYIVVAISLLVAAGIIGLLNRELGQNILFVSILAAGIFLINAVVWSLLQSAVLTRVSIRRTGTVRKK